MKPGYIVRAFSGRNADEIDETQLLDIVVKPPTRDEVDPFSFSNLIIRGEMGSGKTMLLKANLQIYRYQLVTSLLLGEEPILPIYVRLSDFAHIKDPRYIYREIIMTIIKEMIQAHKMLNEAEALANLHSGIKNLVKKYNSPYLDLVDKKTIELTAHEYCNKVRASATTKGSLLSKFLEISGTIEKENITEITKKQEPGITDIRDIFTLLFPKSSKARILILFDEAGTLDAKFFITGNSETSLFETLMNQLRTTPYIRTKIAIYPQSYSDILSETRYGNFLNLTYDITTEDGYRVFRSALEQLVVSYLSTALEENTFLYDYFQVSGSSIHGDAIEQIVYGSKGNFRRAVAILDKIFAAMKEQGGKEKIQTSHAFGALSEQAKDMSRLYKSEEIKYLEAISTVCKDRSTYKFELPLQAQQLSKYCRKSEEYNILYLVEAGSGRRGSQYAFDYAYCILKSIPTHMHGTQGSEKISASRSLADGRWITKKAQLRDEHLQATILRNRQIGSITSVPDSSSPIGSIQTEQNSTIFFFADAFLTVKDMEISRVGSSVKYTTIGWHNQQIATDLEVLDT